jgi:Tfp pilus assembly protein PilN
VSVRVNLLPETTRQREQAGRSLVVIALAFVALLAVLGGLYWLQTQRVAEREAELAREQDRLAELDADLRALAEYEELEARAQRVDGLITASLGAEASLAGVLQDLSTVLPETAWVESFGITVSDEPTFTLGAERSAVGRLTATVVDLRSHAPGIEQLLLDLERMATFSNAFFASATLLEEEALEGATGEEVRFNLEVDLGAEIRTERYRDGLPEELR